MKNFKTDTSGNSRDTSGTSSAASLPFGRKAMAMEPDKDILVLPAEAKLGGPHHPATATWSECAPGRHLCPDLGERVMRMSSSLVAPSAVAILSTALLFAFGSPAVSQTTSGSSLPSVTVVAPKQVAKPHHRPVQTANTGVGYRRARAVRTTTETAARAPAPGSIMARLKELERTSSNCTDGCQTSFKYGNQPWNGCSGSANSFFSPTCKNVRNYKTYNECRETALFLAWRHNELIWYCGSLVSAGKLPGEKVQVADLKRPGR